GNSLRDLFVQSIRIRCFSGCVEGCVNRICSRLERNFAASASTKHREANGPALLPLLPAQAFAWGNCICANLPIMEPDPVYLPAYRAKLQAIYGACSKGCCIYNGGLFSM